MTVVAIATECLHIKIQGIYTSAQTQHKSDILADRVFIIRSLNFSWSTLP